MNKILIIVLLIVSTALMIPDKPKILIIGDSISIGYFPFVKEALKEKADLVHNKGNAQHTGTGLENIDAWLGDTHWDIIQFNWSLWNLAYRNPESKAQGNRDKVNGKITFTPEQYRKNLETLVARLKKTGAKLIFVTTTCVPDAEVGRFTGDALKYNAIATEIMKKNGIAINDLYALSVPVHQEFGLGADNVHYSDKGYEALTKQIVKGLEEILK